MLSLDTPCIPHDGYIRADGYGRIGDRLAHRVTYEDRYGEIPEGMTLDHRCHNDDPACLGGPCAHRACINPDHVELVTMSENSHRRWRKARTKNGSNDPDQGLGLTVGEANP